MLGAPLVGFGFWGAVGFHQAGRFAEPRGGRARRPLQEIDERENCVVAVPADGSSIGV